MLTAIDEQKIDLFLSRPGARKALITVYRRRITYNSLQKTHQFYEALIEKHKTLVSLA